MTLCVHLLFLLAWFPSFLWLRVLVAVFTANCYYYNVWITTVNTEEARDSPL